MIPLLGLLAALSGSQLELGGTLGTGMLVGTGSAAAGRDAGSVDAVRYPRTWSAWMGYQWLRGHLIGLRYQQWYAEGTLTHAEDLGSSLTETLDISTYGIEYTHLIPMRLATWRLGGGIGFASCTDVLDPNELQVKAVGDGSAVWLRSGVEVPFGSFRLHTDVSGLWAFFSNMKPVEKIPLAAYKADFPILQVEVGLALAL